MFALTIKFVLSTQHGFGHNSDTRNPITRQIYESYCIRLQNTTCIRCTKIRFGCTKIPRQHLPKKQRLLQTGRLLQRGHDSLTEGEHAPSLWGSPAPAKENTRQRNIGEQKSRQFKHICACECVTHPKVSACLAIPNTGLAHNEGVTISPP